MTKKLPQIEYISKKTTNKNYQDPAEEFLLDFFDQPAAHKHEEISLLLSSECTWPVRYHLSPQREFILEWYPFEAGKTLLEVGAGCGAVTGLFTRKMEQVIVNELTNQRAQIIAQRHADATNLQIFAGNILELELPAKVDYVTAIGVLEYSGKFVPADIFPGENPHLAPYYGFLEKLRSFLKKGGHILLAIENRLGLKYLAGGREDHYGNLFSGVESYPEYDGIRTFSKNELNVILEKLNFSDWTFYYPYPDYKLPTTILSQEGIDERLSNSFSSFAQISDLSNPRFPLFNEVALARSLYEEKMLGEFANSFLIDIVL